MVPDRNTVRKNTWLAWVLLSAGLVVTIYASINVVLSINAEAKKDFEFACRQIELVVDARVAAHEHVAVNIIKHTL